MQKVLSEIRDFVTTQVRRIAAESLNISGIPSSPFLWNWNEYFKYLSLKGLEEANFYKVDFPDNSDARSLLNQYISAGKIELD